VLALSGATGHSAAIRPVLAIPAKSLHLLAGAAWMGGLLWLLLLYGDDRDRYAAEALRVSSVALWGCVAVAASGILMSAVFLSTPRDLVATAYGVIVLTKSAGLLALLLFGAYHRFRAVPALRANTTPAMLATSVRREVAIFVIVVFLGGLLSYVPPSRPAADSTAPSTVPVE
jgi:putative copper export protein